MVLGTATRGIGSHSAAWRLPWIDRDKLNQSTSLRHWVEPAQIAEAAKMHFLFIADSLCMPGMARPALAERSSLEYCLEPITVLSAIAALTEKIGLVSTVSTTYSDPFNIARYMGSLDHISNGRAGWNLVTTSDPYAAKNFGMMALQKGDRYERAEAFTQVVKGLWDSWEDDAFLKDQKSGVFVDLKKLHLLKHKSEHFSVEGPLPMERPPQGHPVTLVASASDDGMELAAKEADLMFTAQPTREGAKKFYKDVKDRLAKYGRTHDDLLILPGCKIVIGRTDEEAQEKEDAVKSVIDVKFAVLNLSQLAQTDLTGLPLDEPVPESLRNPSWSRLGNVMDTAKRLNLTLKETAINFAHTFGHNTLVGSPTTIADELQATFEEYGSDGFLLSAHYYPEGTRDISSLLIPELQRRGIFQTEYSGNTLRERLGLKRPAHPAQNNSAYAHPI
jgi:N-acetyl-S-(2-succino)cysteine monooxygenase